MWLYIEILGAVVGLLYLWFEYRASIWLWPVSIIMPAIYIFVYFHGGFYADMGINVYYLIASAYGWAMWRRRGGDGEELPITHTPKRYIIPMAAVAVVAFAVIVQILLNFTDSTVPYGDSLTTALSIVGLWMLARKYVEQWLVWVVVDIVCTVLYIYKGLYPTAILYGLYSVIAVFGYLKWKKLARAHKENEKRNETGKIQDAEKQHHREGGDTC